jgi:hypothetical protein
MAEAETKVLQVIVCDDVRREITGKDILIGVYGREIFTPSFPLSVALTLWIRYTRNVTGPFSADFRVVGEGGNAITPPLKMTLGADDTSSYASAVFQGIPLQFQAPGKISFQWKIGEGDWTDLAELIAIQRDISLPGIKLMRADAQ